MALKKYFKTIQTIWNISNWTEQFEQKKKRKSDWSFTKCGRKQSKTIKVSRLDTNWESRDW